MLIVALSARAIEHREVAKVTILMTLLTNRPQIKGLLVTLSWIIVIKCVYNSM